MRKYTSDELSKLSVKKLNEIGVRLEDIGEIVLSLQKKYKPDITLEECIEHIRAVIRKREVAHAILTGLAIDEMAQKDLLPEPILSIIKTDEGLYGIDEVLTLAIVNVYGSIGLTNFGYLDKEKYGIIKKLDEKKNVDGEVATFADDIVAAIAAAAASRIAHTSEE